MQKIVVDYRELMTEFAEIATWKIVGLCSVVGTSRSGGDWPER
jgi:hypothetical protein